MKTSEDKKLFNFSIEQEVFEAKLKFTEQLLDFLQETGLNKKEFAARMKAKPSLVTKLLSGSNNFTFETAVRVCRALGQKFEPQIGEKVDLNEGHIVIFDCNFKGKTPNKFNRRGQNGEGRRAAFQCFEPDRVLFCEEESEMELLTN